jgi:hypothetical protein
MLFEIMPFAMQNKATRKLNPNEAEPNMLAFWQKMHLVEKNIPKSKKNMVLHTELKEGERYLKIYGGEDQTANYTVYDQY